MATLALAAAGSALGSTLLPAGVSIFGATIAGATIGSQIGALAGAYVDNALFGASGQSSAVEGPRLSDLHITSSTEGAPVPRIFGRARLGGQLIWATDIEEEIFTSAQNSGGGEGFMGGGGQTNAMEYRYYGNFAVALCEGPVTRLGRVWADGRELDLSQIVYRFYRGSQTQGTDSLIAAREGAGNAPAYRGVTYVVFERLPLAQFGNRIPQLSFEVENVLDGGNADIRGVVLIPGSGEFVYATEPVTLDLGAGVSQAENVHALSARTDWEAAADQLEAGLANLKSVSLVVSWFGNDLRAGQCQLRPGVEGRGKTTLPFAWSVAGRASAYVVSQRDGRPAYGGTPSDQTVLQAIRDLKARGLNVTLNPFVLMDVAPGNALPDPYGGGEQAAYPWRGRITCHPAPGVSGSPDKTAAAATQLAAFMGTAAPAHFSLSGDTVIYSGPAEWSYRRMVLHQAYLAKAAGGVDAFLIGSELRGLTQVRSGTGAYPFVGALIALAGDVKSILGASTKVLYSADWSEYFGHQPADGSHDVYFHLDPLWASSHIDAIGIDVYWPLADWREGRSHLDYLSGVRSIYDLKYLSGNVQGGEGYDWYYASQANRDNQVRSPILDGTAGKPWVFRYKDIKSWWLSQHFNRPRGVESATPTAWVPQSKPFWLMEVGCPAVDKGANQPNVFVDPKSSESALPYFSRGTRDDYMQRCYLKALIEAFDWMKPGYVSGSNPVSNLTGTRMVDLDHLHVYCWDARPYPAFPYREDIWGDGANWHLGHWITGRLSSAPLCAIVSEILTGFGFSNFDASALNGVVPGYVIDNVMPARDALQPLELAYFFDSIESGAKIVFRHRGQEPAAATVLPDGLVETRAGGDLVTLTRAQETELPASAKVRFISAEDDYRQAVAEGRRLTGGSTRVAQASLAIVMDDALASSVADTWLFESWASRERVSFNLPPSALALEPGDSVLLLHAGATRTLRITTVSEHNVREIDALGLDPEIYGGLGAQSRTPRTPAQVQVGKPAVLLIDLPLLTGSENPEDGYAAAAQAPWPGSVSIYASPQTTGYQFKALAVAPATLGTTLDPLPAGCEGRFDWRAKLRVKIPSGQLASLPAVQVFSGGNAAAVMNGNGDWEVIQFLNATLVDAATYELSGLLRGQAGTETAFGAPPAAGAPFVLLDGALARVPLSLADIRRPLNWRYGPSNRDLADVSYSAVSHAFQGLGLRPLSPSHVKGTRNGTGDLALSWIRRTRTGGDSWEVADVPLGETSEAYEIDILSGVTVKRTLTVSSPFAAYTVAQQIADFSAPQSAIAVAVYQMSAVYGRGAPRFATL